MKRLSLLALLALAGPALAALPTLQTHTEAGISVDKPEGWKVLVDADKANVVTSRDAFTSVTVQWFPFDKDITPAKLDELLDILLKSTNDALPVGSATEQSRRPLGDDGRLMIAEYSNLLGYSMKLAFAVIVDQADKRVITSVMMTSPESFAELSADELVEKVARSIEGGPRGPKKAAAPSD